MNELYKVIINLGIALLLFVSSWIEGVSGSFGSIIGLACGLLTVNALAWSEKK